MDRIFKLTDLGKRVSSNSSPNKRDVILDFLHSNKSATVYELATVSGLSKFRVLSELRKMQGSGLVEEVTGG